VAMISRMRRRLAVLMAYTSTTVSSAMA
jgi:hypothetical protein